MGEETMRRDYSEMVRLVRDESNKYVKQGGYALAMGGSMALGLIVSCIENGPELSWSNVLWGLAAVALIGNSIRLIAGARRVRNKLEVLNESRAVLVKDPHK